MDSLTEQKPALHSAWQCSHAPLVQPEIFQMDYDKELKLKKQ